MAQMNLADCTDNTWASCFQVLLIFFPSILDPTLYNWMTMFNIVVSRRLQRRSWISRQMSLVVFNRRQRRGFKME